MRKEIICIELELVLKKKFLKYISCCIKILTFI
nr:MAG TPA: hypothetical protein [Bacteriophage sp.]